MLFFVGERGSTKTKFSSQFWSHVRKKCKRINGMKAMHKYSIDYCLRERVIKVPIFLFVCL